MQPLDPEEMEAEILLFNMDLERAFQKDGPLYITIHRDVVQGMIDSHTDISGCNLAQEEKISDLLLELEILLEQFETLKGNAMNDTENNEAETENPGVPIPGINDAIELGLTQLASAIEVGKSISRREVVIDIDTAVYVLGMLAYFNDPTVDKISDDFAEVDEDDTSPDWEEFKDLTERVSSLEDDIVGHIERVAKRDQSILELQNQIENNAITALVQLNNLEKEIAEAGVTIDAYQDAMTEAGVEIPSVETVPAKVETTGEVIEKAQKHADKKAKKK